MFRPLRNLYILIPGLCGLLFLLWLSSCARLSFDELAFAATFKTLSLKDAFVTLASTHNLRWTTLLIQYLLFGIIDGTHYPAVILLFFLIFYGIWIQQLGLLTRLSAKRFMAMEVERLTSWGLASLAISVLYFFTSQAVEVFTFMGAVTDRLLPFLLMTWGLNLLLSSGSPGNRFAIVLCAFLMAGTGENGTLSLLTACFVFATHRRFWRKKTLSFSFVLFTTSLLTFFVIENLSAGNATRLQVERTHHFTCGTGGGYCAETLNIFLPRLFAPRMLLALPLLLVFSVFSFGLHEEAKEKLGNYCARSIKFFLFLLPPVVALHVIIAFAVFDNYGPLRIWMPVNGLLAVLSVATAIWLGTRFGAHWLKYAAGILACGVIAFYFSRYFSGTNGYARAYDARVAYLLQIKTPDSVVTVPPLPPSGIVVQGDIMVDAKDDVNRDFKNTYRLPFDVKRK